MSKRAYPTSPGGLVRLCPPSGKCVYFRVEYRDEFNRRRQTKAGRDFQGAMLVAEDIERRLQAGAKDAQSATHVRHLVEGYLDPERDKFRSVDGRCAWSAGYEAMVRRRLATVLHQAGNVHLRHFSARQVAALLESCATEAAARDLRNTLRAMVNFGVASKYLRADQANIWDVDLPTGKAPTLARSKAAPFAPVARIAASKVPTVAKVCALAAAPLRYPWWEGLVYTLAGAGLRIHEALALRACDVIPSEEGVVLLVERQLLELEGGGVSFGPPKNGYARLVPVGGRYFADFDLAEWLLERAATALDEQAAGRNSDAILFATPRDATYWRLRNLRRDLFVPAAEAAHWASIDVDVHTTGKNGKAKVIRQRRWVHTIHSLRHRYATTAIEDWGFEGSELTASGGWASENFVFQHYYGASDDTLSSAQRKQVAHASRVGEPV